MYVHVPNADQQNGSKLVLEKCSAGDIRSHLMNGHNDHNLLPDFELVIAQPQLRVVPPRAKELILSMRQAGMQLMDIYDAIKVIATTEEQFTTVVVGAISR